MSGTEKVDVEKLLQSGEVVELYPEGWSMFPCIIPDRDSVVVAPIKSAGDIKKGDIILYRSDEGRLILHRVHHVEGESFYEWGDNSLIIRGPIDASRLRGRVAVFKRRGYRITDKNLLYRCYVLIWPHIQPIRRLASKLIGGRS